MDLSKWGSHNFIYSSEKWKPFECFLRCQLSVNYVCAKMCRDWGTKSSALKVTFIGLLLFNVPHQSYRTSVRKVLGIIKFVYLLSTKKKEIDGKIYLETFLNNRTPVLLLHLYDTIPILGTITPKIWTRLGWVLIMQPVRLSG